MGWQIKTKDGTLYGPVDSETLNKWAQEKRILDEDFVWMEDKNQWVIIKSVPELRYLFHGGIPPVKRQEISEIHVPAAQKASDVFYDDKKILTDQLIADAWRAMLAKGIWSIIGAIFMIAIVVMGVAIPLMIGQRIIPKYLLGFSFIGGLLIDFIWYLFAAALILGWAAYSLKIARRESVNVSSVFEGFRGKYIWHALGVYLLTALLPGLASIISFGIWGFYLTLAYTFSYFFIFDENRGPWQSMKASFDATKGYKWRIMSVQIICMLLGILFLGIGLFVTMPIAYIATASLYYRIRTGRISEKHLQTSFTEYLIVLIPFILIIVLIVFIFAIIFMKQVPFLSPQVADIIRNLLKESVKR